LYLFYSAFFPSLV